MITDDLKQQARWSVKQDGNAVILTMRCLNEYEAMLLHDKIVHAVEHGGVAFTYRGNGPPLESE